MPDTPKVGSRGVYTADLEQTVPYGIYDADHHLYAPDDAVTRYLPTEMIDRAWLPGEPHMLTDEEYDEEVTTTGARSAFTRSPKADYGGVDLSAAPEMEGRIPIPGAMLNKLNPMRDLDQLSREQLVERYNAMRPAFERKDPAPSL